MPIIVPPRIFTSTYFPINNAEVQEVVLGVCHQIWQERVHILILMADIFRTRSRAQRMTWQPLSMRVIVWGNYKTRLPVWKPRYAMVAYSRMLQRIMMSHLFVILKSEMQSYVGCQQFYLNYFCQKLSKPQPNLNTRLGLIIKWLYTGDNWAAEWNHPSYKVFSCKDVRSKFFGVRLLDVQSNTQSRSCNGHPSNHLLQILASQLFYHWANGTWLKVIYEI